MGRKLNKNSFIKNIIIGLFIVYMLILLKLILFKTVSLKQLFGNYIRMRSINLVPFKTIFEYASNYKAAGTFEALSNILGNLVLFIPFGYLIPTIFRKFSKFRRVLLLTFCLSLLFEVVQYVLGIGSSDIDDIILNTLGGTFGYAVFFYLNKLFTKELFKNIAILIGTVVFLVSGFAVAYEKYGVMLHLTKLHEVVQGGNDIPKGRSDIMGKFLASGNKDLEITIKYNNVKGRESGISQAYKNGNKLDIILDKATKVYLEESSYSNNTMTLKYKKLSRDKLSKVTKNSLIMAWGNLKNGGFDGNIIVVLADK